MLTSITTQAAGFSSAPYRRMYTVFDAAPAINDDDRRRRRTGTEARAPVATRRRKGPAVYGRVVHGHLSAAAAVLSVGRR